MSPAKPDPRDVAIARAVLAGAVIGGAYLLLRSRPVRGLLWRGVRFAAFTWAPAFVVSQVREAWAESRPPARSGELGPADPGADPGPAHAPPSS